MNPFVSLFSYARLTFSMGMVAIRAGRPAEVTVQDGARATIGCLRLLESARTGQARRLDWQAVVAPGS